VLSTEANPITYPAFEFSKGISGQGMDNSANIICGRGTYDYAAEPQLVRRLEARSRAVELEHPDSLATMNIWLVYTDIKGSIMPRNLRLCNVWRHEVVFWD
jgi:hypothetical protein